MADLEKEELFAREIRDLKAKGSLQLTGMDPRKRFFMAVVVGNLDGSLENIDGVECISNEELEAVTVAKEVNEDYPGLEVWIYRCEPIVKVWRGKPKVTRFK